MASVNNTSRAGALRSARRAAGLTQQQLAVLGDCSMTYVRMLETGFTPRASDILPRLERLLSLTSTSEAPGAESEGFAKTAGGTAGRARPE